MLLLTGWLPNLRRGEDPSTESSGEAASTSLSPQQGARKSKVPAAVSRELLEDRIAKRVLRDDAMLSLPFSCCYMAVFISLVTVHLQIFRRQRVEYGLESWVTGYGDSLPGPYLEEHVNDVDSFFIWLHASGSKALLGNLNNRTGLYRPTVALYSVLLGDVQLQQRPKGSSPQSVWLLHTPQAVEYLQRHGASSRNPGGSSLVYAQALDTAAEQVRSSNWTRRGENRIALRYATYNEKVKIFALNEIILDLPGNGFVKPIVVSTAVLINPYDDRLKFVLDAIFVIMLLFVLVTETRDLCHALRLGQFFDYWGFWNCVDWTSIVLGLVICGLWGWCCACMQADELRRLLHEETLAVSADVMSLDTAALDQILVAVDKIQHGFFVLQVVMATNVCSLILRFFKGFNANARLQAVTNTFIGSAEDIVHFLMVFTAVFICFVLLGHVMFGNDVSEFRTFQVSINTAFMALSGEFSWVIELLEKDDAIMPSGMPRVFVILWIVSLLVLLSIVMMNMLVAIILDQWQQEAQRIDDNEDTSSVWVQIYHFIRFKLQSRGFVPLYQIQCALEHNDFNTHSSGDVTVESLQQACDIKSDQAQWLMTWLREEAEKKNAKLNEQDDDDTGKRMECILQGVVAELRDLTPQLQLCGEKLQQLQDCMGSQCRPFSGKTERL